MYVLSPHNLAIGQVTLRSLIVRLFSPVMCYLLDARSAMYLRKGLVSRDPHDSFRWTFPFSLTPPFNRSVRQEYCLMFFLCASFKPWLPKNRRPKERVQQHLSGPRTEQASSPATAEPMPASDLSSPPPPTLTYGPCIVTTRCEPCPCTKGSFISSGGPLENLSCLNCRHLFVAHNPSNDSPAVAVAGHSNSAARPKVMSRPQCALSRECICCLRSSFFLDMCRFMLTL
jgi:hypothetical protein